MLGALYTNNAVQFKEDTTFEEKTQLSPEKMQLSDPKAQPSAYSEDG